MQKILLVDDEQNVLNALKRELKDYYEVETFNNPVWALEHCKKEQFDLVISDYKMPEMNGLEFLKKFGSLQPDASRLVLSGEADMEALIRTINETHIYRFIAKPWDSADLLSSIQQALSYREAILENRRKEKLIREHQNASQVPQDESPYRIIVVESNERLLTLMSRGLLDESGHDSLYGAIQQESGQGAHIKTFKCVVDTFQSAKAALAHAEKNHCDLVITAQNLSDMDGIQLLSKMRDAAPDAARILISNTPNKAMISQAINEANVQSLLQMNWSNHDPRTDVRRQAWNLHQLKIASIQALTARNLILEDTRSTT
jgi:two-component system probable response regulator PhcQ